MPQSMTGFARAEQPLRGGLLVCELRSVNQRFVDLHFRLPDSLRALEGEFRQRLKQNFARGKIECSVQFQAAPGDTGELAVDLPLVERYLAVAEQIRQRMPDARPDAVFDMLRLPGVMGGEPSLPDDFAERALELVDRAIDLLREARLREGAVLAELILQRVQRIRSEAAQVRAAVPEIRQAQRQRLLERLTEIAGEGFEPDGARLEQEMVLLAQRGDVDEELDRLAAHLDEVERNLELAEPVGRRLDFLMQELNREANTLGSKAQALPVTNSAVEIKVLIEQMREQIQNIE